MTNSRLFSLILAVFPSLLMSAAAYAQSDQAVAKAIRQAARLEVQADFWMNVATTLSNPGGNLREQLSEAWDERNAGLIMADRQFQSRLLYEQRLDEKFYRPKIVASQFSALVDNPYLPQVPGRTLVYERQMQDGVERIEISALHGSVMVNGIECQPVREYETIDGVLVEDTQNWMAQHVSGDVWYFGEVAQAFEGGFLESLDGSWRYGCDDAQPGLLMLRENFIGEAYRQEYALNVAEDIAEILATGITVTTPVGTFHDCIKVLEVTPIDPDDVVQKIYAPGVGMVLEVDLTTGERSELIEIRN
ncbi:MAG: hypothetical protein H8E15_09985 [Planctomycetes bacterium]|nr:hypothetical protein [Planctomycetota bacterium]